MKKRRRPTTIQDVNALAVTPRTLRLPEYETISQQIAREEREEQARREAPIRKLESEYSQGLRENRENVRSFFSLPIEQLNNARPSAVPVDFGIGNFPETAERMSVEEYRNLQLEFWQTLKARTCDLTESGWIRLNIYVGTLNRERKFAVTLDVMEASFQRLLDLGCFNDGEIKGTIPLKTQAPAPAPVAQPQPSVDSLRTDDPRWMRTVNNGWSNEFAQWMSAWCESLKKNFDYDFPEELGNKAAEYLQRWNLSPFRYESWDKVRVAFVKLGYFRSDMLTPSEHLSELVESADMSNRDVRRDFGLRTREIINSGPPIPRHK